MSDCFITRRGGGGAGLNFEVVGGTTQPTNPKENTIWINTDAEITWWTFGTTEPSEPVEGMVWIETSTTSEAQFNALKKNELNVYPLVAHQYISGAWVEKVVMVYQNGEWKTLITELYIIENGVRDAAAAAGSWIYTDDNSPSTSKSGSYLVYTSSGNGYHAIGYGPVDLTGYKTVKMEGSYSVTNNDVHNCLAVNTKLARPVDSYVAYKPFSSSGASIDVSSLTGKHYVIFAFNYNTSRTYKTKNLYLIP